MVNIKIMASFLHTHFISKKMEGVCLLRAGLVSKSGLQACTGASKEGNVMESPSPKLRTNWWSAKQLLQSLVRILRGQFGALLLPIIAWSYRSFTSEGP